MSKRTTTTKHLIMEAMESNGESWSDLEEIAIDGGPSNLDREFDPSHGSVEGPRYTAWTKNNVYFPICYDGAEWCGSIARNPNGLPTEHQGG